MQILKIRFYSKFKFNKYLKKFSELQREHNPKNHSLTEELLQNSLYSKLCLFLDILYNSNNLKPSFCQH